MSDTGLPVPGDTAPKVGETVLDQATNFPDVPDIPDSNPNSPNGEDSQLTKEGAFYFGVFIVAIALIYFGLGECKRRLQRMTPGKDWDE